MTESPALRGVEQQKAYLGDHGNLGLGVWGLGFRVLGGLGVFGV